LSGRRRKSRDGADRRSGAPLSYSVGVGTSFTQYRGSGFWTRDAALEAVLALLVVELEPVASDDEALESVLDAWTVQAVAGFTGCVSPGLDEHLTARPSLAAAVTAALKRIRDRLPPGGSFVVGSAALARRADRVCEGYVWSTPGAAPSWAGNVADAMHDLVAGCLPDVPGAFWFVDGDGRHTRPKQRPRDKRPPSKEDASHTAD
jgi:hypothetical protein